MSSFSSVNMVKENGIQQGSTDFTMKNKEYDGFVRIQWSFLMGISGIKPGWHTPNYMTWRFECEINRIKWMIFQ